jgi:hypothetical protein
VSNFKTVLEATTDEFRALLPAHGFAGEPKRETGAAYRRIWVRHAGWKTDSIEIVYRRGGESSLLVNLQVWLPIPERDEPVLFDCRGVATPRIPSLRWKWVMRRHTRRVIEEVEADLPWFDSLESPKSCLDSLANPDRNTARPGRLAEAMSSYLKSVAGGEQWNPTGHK